MTLIATVNGPDSIWLMADRRLSAKGHPPQDDGRKLMDLETTDGRATLGYAGLGKTAGGTEPADWMSAVLRGRNLPLEHSLSVLGEAVKKEIPRQIVRMPGRAAHSVIVPAFVGEEARLYTIDIEFAPDRKCYRWRCTRHVHTTTRLKPPRLALGGSGATYLLRNRRWIRPLLRVVRAHDRRQVPASVVADELARINDEVARADPLVGPRCIVMWRYRKGCAQGGGGAHQFYNGTARERIQHPYRPSRKGWTWRPSSG